MQNKLFIIFIFVLSTLQAHAWQVESGSGLQDLMAVQAKASVYTELSQYFESSKPATVHSYTTAFIPTIHKMMILEAHKSIEKKLGETTCTSTTQVTFPEQITRLTSFSEKEDFEENFVKVQSYACLGQLNLDRVFETLMSDSFQKKGIPGIKSIKSNPSTNEVCIQTSLLAIGTSNYCLSKKVIRNKNQYIIHSFNENNINNPSAPIYFKETINILTQLENGEVSFYNLMYARGPDLSFRGLIKNKIISQQNEITRLLIDMSK